MADQWNEILQECIDPLRPYFGQIVVAGGWVPYLYTKLYETSVANEPLFTSDFDVAIVRHGLIERDDTTLDRSILDSDFEYKFASLDKPPVVKYIKKLENGQQAEIEFITEAENAEKVEIVGSINAQALHNVGLLLDDPWSFPLADFGIDGEGELRLPRPSMFIMHKMLVAPRRRQRDKRAKDLYYGFYVLDSFPSWREDIFNEVRKFATENRKIASGVALYLDSMFDGIDSEGVALLASQRPQTAYRFMSDDQFYRYALNRIQELRRSI